MHNALDGKQQKPIDYYKCRLGVEFVGLLFLGASVFLIQSWMEQVLGCAAIILWVLIEVFKARNLSALNFQGEGIGAGTASDRE